jgi:hypothetical protein
MVLIVALLGAWLVCLVVLAALARVAARSDRLTAEHHLALLRGQGSRLWLAPRSDD